MWGSGSSAQQKESRPLATIHASKDPASFTVIIEDTAALVGLTLAFIGTLLNQAFGWHQADGIAATAIGTMLAIVAVLLIVESKALLVGRERTSQCCAAFTRSSKLTAVWTAGYPMTMYFGSQSTLLTINVRFHQALQRDGIEQSIDRMEDAVRHRYPKVRHIYIEAESLRERHRDMSPSVLPPLPLDQETFGRQRL